MRSIACSAASSTRSSTRSQPTSGDASLAASNAATWSATRAEVARQLAAAGIVTAEAEARFLVEEVSGYAAAEWLEIADQPPPERPLKRLWPLVDPPLARQPAPYVLR